VDDVPKTISFECFSKSNAQVDGKKIQQNDGIDSITSEQDKSTFSFLTVRADRKNNKIAHDDILLLQLLMQNHPPAIQQK
jgi:hypothetical protein